MYLRSRCARGLTIILWSRIILAALPCLPAMTDTASAQGGPLTARVVSASGRATLLATGRAPAPINQGNPLTPGNVIDTTAGGRVVIELSDGSQIVVHPGSRVALKDFRNAGSLRELLEITVGRIRVRINHLGRRPNPCRLTSPAATIAVRGTDFFVNVEASGETQVFVYEGLVEVASRAFPQRRTLLESGRSVIVRPGGDISLVSQGPGSELNATTKLAHGKVDPFSETYGSYQQYADNLTAVNNVPAPTRYAAVADPHFDSLENPAYATEFSQAEGRLYLLPSFSAARQRITATDRSAAEPVHAFDSTLFSQTSYFLPLAGSRLVLGGVVSAARTSLQSFTLDDLFSGSQKATTAESGLTKLTTVNASLLAARRFGREGHTSLGLKLDQLAGRGRFVSVNNLIQNGESFPVRLESRARVDRTRLTLGLTHDFAGGRKLGLFFLQGAISADGRDRNALPDEAEIDQLIAQHSVTRTSEMGIRWRGALTRRLFYGVEGSLLFKRLSIHAENTNHLSYDAEKSFNSRIRGSRAALGGGMSYELRPHTILSFDVAGGVSRDKRRAVAEPTKREFGGRFRGQFLTLHASAQTDLWRPFFATASILTVTEWDSLVGLTGTPLFARRFTRHFSTFGAGWRIQPDLLVQYILSTDYGRSAPSHSLMLRYSFDLGGKK